MYLVRALGPNEGVVVVTNATTDPISQVERAWRAGEIDIPGDDVEFYEGELFDCETPVAIVTFFRRQFVPYDYLADLELELQ